MGSRGPARVPLSTLKARGSWLAKTRDDAPTVEGPPEPPPWMEPKAQPFWDYILTIVHSSVLSKQDGPHIAELAMEFARREELKAEIAKCGGESMVMENGGVCWFAKMIRESSNRIDKLLSKLGMTPADRSTVAAAPAADKGRIGKFVGVA